MIMIERDLKCCQCFIAGSFTLIYPFNFLPSPWQDYSKPQKRNENACMKQMEGVNVITTWPKQP